MGDTEEQKTQGFEALQQNFEQIHQDLQGLQAIATQPEFDGTALQRQFQQAQQQFQAELSRAASQEAADPPQLAAIHTEMNRLMRLLSMDVMGLRTARNPETRQQRLQQLGDRLHRLLEFCDGALTLLNPSEADAPES